MAAENEAKMAAEKVLELWQIICFSIISLLGLIGNSIVCLVMVMGGTRLRSVPFNAYITSVAATDLLLAVAGIPIYVVSKSQFHHPAGITGDVLCKFITGNLVPFWLAGSSVYLLVLLSFERYYAIKDPFLARTRSTSKKTIVAIAGALLLGFVVQIPVVVGVKFVSSNATISSHCAYRWKSKTVTFFIYLITLACQYVVPALLFVYNFIRIRKCLLNLDEILNRPSARGKENRAIMKQKKRTVRTVFLLVVVFFICWTPNTIMFFLFQYADVKALKANSDIFEVSVVLAFSSAWVNPMLYSFRSKQFRRNCKDTFDRIYRQLKSL